MSATLRRIARRWLRPGIARDVAGAGSPRNALVLYTVRAFTDAASVTLHQNVAQQRELAAALGELGYAVDVVDFDEDRVALLRPAYDLVVDLHPKPAPFYRERLAPGAIRIAYLTGSRPAVADAAERERIADLERRRGIVLAPRRQVGAFDDDALAGYDAFFYFGDAMTLGTFAGVALPPAYALPNSGYEVEATDAGRRDPRRFLFLGSAGQVHKGLDLLLECFAAEPGLTLDVCADLASEPDFTRAFRAELAAPNVRARGFVDVTSAGFRELQAGCGAMILPSSSEGQSGTVIVALAHGLPVIASRWCGVEDPALEILPDCAPATIRDAVRRRAAWAPTQVAAASRASRALFERRFRPEHYARAVRAALREVIARAGARAR